MIKMDDPVKIAKMDSENRKKAMQEVFNEMFKHSDEEKVDLIKNFITGIRAVDDSTYIGLCTTNLDLAAGMGENELKAFVGIRMKANSELPPDLKARDMKLLQAAMGKVPASVSGKISKFMQQ